MDRFEPRHNQEGMTLVELLVATLLTSIVCAFMLIAILTTTRADASNDQESRALAQLRISAGRVMNELREARRLYADSTSTRLHFWVDTDRDNQQDPGERITYLIRSKTGATPVADGTPAVMVRRTDAPGSTEMLISDELQLFPPDAAGTVPELRRDTFQYPTYQPFTQVPSPSTTWTDVTLVSFVLAADTAPGPYPAARTLKTDVRMRNARTF